MRRTMSVIVLFFLVSIMAGCQSNPQRPLETINYFEGSDGLVVEFLDNSPPEQVYSNSVFPLAVRLENKGAWDVVDPFFAEASIVYDSLYFEEVEEEALSDERSHIELHGKSPQYPEGEGVLTTLALLRAKPLAPRTGADAKILLGLCFPYQTTLSEQVCVDGDVYNLDEREQVCQAEDLVLSDQGAPVAITSVEFESLPAGTEQVTVDSQAPVVDSNEQFTGTSTETTTESVPLVRPVFRLSLRNVGGGEIVRARNPDEQALCDVLPVGEGFDRNTVLVKAWLGNTELECFPKTPRFVNGESEVTCTVPGNTHVSVRSNYYELFRAELYYVYRVREAVEVSIIDTDQEYRPPSLLTKKCSDFDREKEWCFAYASLLGCSWCEVTKSCLEDTSCSQCGTHTVFDDRRHECVPPCPHDPLRFSVSYSRVKGQVSLSCFDTVARGPATGEKVDHNRCGCDESSFYYDVSSEEFDCDRASWKKVSGEYDGSKTVAVVSVGDDAKWVCAYAVSKSGVKTDVIGKKLV